MIEQQHTRSTAPFSSREQALELEVARLTAEVETLRGEDPTTATSRFLAMAAATVDQAVVDARREADELAEEIRAEAESRRDEATRRAAEAEATAERLKDEAARAQAILDEANDEAEAIRASAVSEAAALAAAERERVAAEIESLTEVRAALEDERAALEGYHEELTRRVQDMAESMVAFMTTEPPILGALAPGDTPELDAETELETEVEPEVEPEAETEVETEVETELETETEAETEWVAGVDVETEAETQAASVAGVDAETEVETEADMDAETEAKSDTDTAADAGWIDVDDETWIDGLFEPEAPLGAHTDSDESADTDSDDPGFTKALADAPSVESEALGDIVADDSDGFAGVPVIDDVGPGVGAAGLFDRATEEEVATRPRRGSLFGAHGSRWVEQTDPNRLAAALEDEGTEADEAFEAFLSGDEPDPSRDWLLRPDQP